MKVFTCHFRTPILTNWRIYIKTWRVYNKFYLWGIRAAAFPITQSLNVLDFCCEKPKNARVLHNRVHLAIKGKFYSKFPDVLLKVKLKTEVSIFIIPLMDYTTVLSLKFLARNHNRILVKLKLGLDQRSPTLSFFSFVFFCEEDTLCIREYNLAGHLTSLL